MKKNNKQRVLDFMQEYAMEYEHDDYPDVSTNFLSEKLDLQRTNLSSLLNQLVKEGKLTKSNGRPVLYRLVKEGEKSDNDAFSNLIGADGSLEKAVNLAKAAVLYPGGKSSILLTAEKGCETNYFTKTMYEFAKEANAFTVNAPYIVFECKTFMDNPAQLHQVLFGTDKSEGLIAKAKHGMLVLKHVDLLSGYDQEEFLSYERECILVCHMGTDENDQTLKLWKNQMDFSIELLPLRKRPKLERFLLIERFFQTEAGKIQKKIEVDTSILHSLLLYETTDNVRSLRNDIRTGCANCYARSHQQKLQFVELLFSDFPNYIRKGLIYYKSEKEVIDQIVLPNYKYAFGEKEILKSNALDHNANIYQTIDVRKKNLKRQKIKEEEINSMVSLNLQKDFDEYFTQLCGKVQTRQQLELLVSEKLTEQVNLFLAKASKEMKCEFDENVFFALCLHVNGCLVKVNEKQRISNEEISEMISQYPLPYSLARQFVHQMEEAFFLKLNIDEIIFIMMFLLKGLGGEEKKTVSTLIVMHGDSSATSIANVINIMANEENTYAYDLKLEQNIKSAYEELKEMVKEVDQGKGIVLIYDMGSIKTMAESIAEETNIQIKSIEVPITLLGVASSNKAATASSLEEVSQYLEQDLKIGETPYARVNQLFSRETKELEDLLKENIQEVQEEEEVENVLEEEGVQEVFDYLEVQFEHIDMVKMRECLQTLLQALSNITKFKLDEDMKIGLIVHIVCLIDRLQNHQTPSVNFIASEILGKQPQLVQKVKVLVQPIENEFEVTINDTEIATIISIINQR